MDSRISVACGPPAIADPGVLFIIRPNNPSLSDPSDRSAKPYTARRLSIMRFRTRLWHPHGELRRSPDEDDDVEHDEVDLDDDETEEEAGETADDADDDADDDEDYDEDFDDDGFDDEDDDFDDDDLDEDDLDEDEEEEEIEDEHEEEK
ncbi:MAG: hypothetical protein HYU51_08130 [Candidatus Rokubacteria bacterium]|nr:hypothetical protein [Candidatus Rokubacteria bacterium]